MSGSFLSPEIPHSSARSTADGWNGEITARTAAGRARLRRR